MMEKSIGSFVRAATGLLMLLALTLPARADSAFPTSIDVYPYPILASPAKYPVTVDGCGVSRQGHRLHIGFSFTNLELDPMTSVKISVDLYDTFHTFLTTLDSTISGTYAPGARIDVPEFDQPGNKMPLFFAWDQWPQASGAVCYVTSVLYANGDVWNASERPSFAAASHAAQTLTRNAGSDAQKTIAKDRAAQKSLGIVEMLVLPSPENVPDEFKTEEPGIYTELKMPVLHMLSYTKLTGPGARKPFAPEDIGFARAMDGVQVVDRHTVTVCGGRTAEFLTLNGTLSSGPQTIDAIELHAGSVSYVASYSRNLGASPIAAAEAALSNLCH